MPDHRIRGAATATARWIVSRPLEQAHRRWRLRGLVWCHGCGAMVPRLGNDELCPQCEEIDARLAAHLGWASIDLAERMIGLALDYLHPDDVRRVLDELAGEREPAEAPVARLTARSHAAVAGRVARTSRGIRSHLSAANPRLDRRSRRTR